LAAYQKAQAACNAKLKDIAARIKHQGQGSPGPSLA